MPSVLVTGAARGIGRAIVDHLASSGWDVVAGVRSEQDAAAITKDDMVLETEAAMSPGHRELYAKHITGMKKFIPMARKTAVPTDKVVAVVEEALTARRPRARYVVGLGPKLQIALVTNMPAALRDRVMSMMVGLPRRPRG